MKALLPILAGLGLLTAACSNETCDQNQSALPLAAFYSYDTGQPVSIRGMKVGALGAPGDSLLLDTTAASQLYMPFNIEAPSTSFTFDYGHGVIDTLKVAYDVIPYFASEACGAMYKYRMTSVTHTSRLLDSVGVVDSMVTNYDAAVLHLYFGSMQ